MLQFFYSGSWSFVRVYAGRQVDGKAKMGKRELFTCSLMPCKQKFKQTKIIKINPHRTK